MAYVKIWVHAVWGTKNRYPFLTREIRPKIIEHIKSNAKQKGIFVDTINGHTEHLHALFALNADMGISKAMQLIKGEAAFWANKEKIADGKFEWADEYFAVSVSESALDAVRTYINKQEEHHKKLSFAQEYEKFMSAYKFKSQG